MEISLCKILKDYDISFYFYLKLYAHYFDKIIIISEKNFSDNDNYFKSLKEISEVYIFEKIEDYYSHKFIKNIFELIKTEYLLLLDANEYIKEDFLQFLKTQNTLTENIYNLPVTFNSQLQNQIIYKTKLFKRNYNSNDKIGVLENYIYLSQTPLIEDFEINAIKEYKNLILNSESNYLKSQACFNLSSLYKNLNLLEKSFEYLKKSYSFDENNPLANYFLAIGETDNDKKINYYKKVFEYKAILEKWENFLLKEYFEKASIYLADIETDNNKKINYYKTAHFYSPDNIETQIKLFELIKTSKTFDNPKVSVVIPSCNNFEYLSQTIRTLIINTDINLEIIVIEDGIISEMAETFYKNNKWIKVFKNEKNLGFIKSVNKGVKLASCDYVLILNDDVFIGFQAIDILLNNLLNDSQIGAIGAWQDELFIKENKFEIPNISFNSSFEFYQFAKENLIKNKDVCISANILSGFCLMMSKKLIDKISLNCGLFDEVYGFGYFEDFDLCERIKKHNYKLKISLDSLVYHFMSVSVKKEGIRKIRLSNRNKEIFLNRYYPHLQVNSNTRKDSLSLCMIVKNEEEHLEKCLASVESICDEIIIVDTGSNDKTIDIAEKFGAKIFNYKWENDFSKARNLSINPAIMNWILWLDADDYVNKKYLNILKEFLNQDNFNIARIPIVSPQENNDVQQIYQYRLFKNKQGIYFKGFIHEAPVIKTIAFDLDMKIYHCGYFDSKTLKSKLERNLKIIEYNLKENPFDEYVLFQYINIVFFQILDIDKTIEFSQIFLEHIRLTETNKVIFYQVYLIYSKALFYKFETEKALKSAFNSLDLIPSLPEPYLWLGFMFEYLKLYDYAILYYQKVLELTPPKFNGKTVDLEIYRTKPINEINKIKTLKKIAD